MEFSNSHRSRKEQSHFNLRGLEKNPFNEYFCCHCYNIFKINFPNQKIFSWIVSTFQKGRISFKKIGLTVSKELLCFPKGPIYKTTCSLVGFEGQSCCLSRNFYLIYVHCIIQIILGKLLTSHFLKEQRISGISST